jgi:hypothetical protein
LLKTEKRDLLAGGPVQLLFTIFADIEKRIVASV